MDLLASKSVIKLSSEKALTGWVLEGLDTWTKTLTWAKLDAEAWKKIAVELGAEEVEDNLTIAMDTDEDYAEAAATVGMKGIAKARLNVAVNVARRKMGSPISDIFARSMTTPPVTPRALPEQSQGIDETQLATLQQPGVMKNNLHACTLWD